MKYGEFINLVRKILADVNAEQQLNLVSLLGDTEYGVLEKVLSSEIARFVASEVGGLDYD